MKATRVCETCGISYQTFPSIRKRFCGKKCSRPMIGRSKQENPNWKGGGVKLTCTYCGKEYEVRPHLKNASLFCSKDCFQNGAFNRSASRWRTGSRWGMSSTKSGKRADIGIFVRSAWEANYARYLNWLKSIGAVVLWGYEEETFEFPGIKRGTRFYTPDFKITWKDGTVEYHEVKGWMHPKGKTALARMAKYHPNVKIVLIQQKEYRAISRQHRNTIPGWEIGSDRY